MKHKTAELEGALLDAAVAKAEGHKIVGDDIHDAKTAYLIERTDYSIDWAIGGPIIERERITLVLLDGQWAAWHHQDFGSYIEQSKSEADSIGSTQLVAAMRAYVVFKLGEEVELP